MRKYVQPEMEIDLFDENDGLILAASPPDCEWDCSCEWDGCECACAGDSSSDNFADMGETGWI